MTLRLPFAALAVIACVSASAAPTQPEFQQFEGGTAAKAALASAASREAVPAPHKHVMKSVTRADGSVVLTCATEPNPKFVAFERERTATQEK